MNRPADEVERERFGRSPSAGAGPAPEGAESGAPGKPFPAGSGGSRGEAGERRRRVLVLVAVVVVAAAVLDRVVLGPVAGLWRGLSARLSARQAELSAARELIKRAESMRAQYRRLARYVEGEPGTRESEFLAFLHAASQRAGVRIASEKPVRNWRGGRGAVRYAETTVSLTFTSSLEALVRFLVELAAGEEPVRVRSVRIVGQDPAGRSLEVALRLSTVILPGGSEGTAAGPRRGAGSPGSGSTKPAPGSRPAASGSVLPAGGTERPGSRPQESGAGAAESLYRRYRVIVERNVFSRFARSPRPEPPPVAQPKEPPPPPTPPPGAGYILTGVVLGGEVPVALVEETSTGRTRLYRLGAETPAGRLEAVRMEGVELAEGGRRRHIRVGYTLSGEPSGKLSRLTTLEPVSQAGGERPGGSAAGSRRPPRLFGRPEAGSAGRPSAPRFRRWTREEIIRRLRERRLRELAGAGGRQGGTGE